MTKICLVEHVVKGFSDQPIPVGALFDDDSEFVTGDADLWGDDVPPVPPVKKVAGKKPGAVRKFGEKPSTATSDPTVADPDPDDDPEPVNEASPEPDTTSTAPDWGIR